MSDNEKHRMIGELVEQRRNAEKKRNEIDHKLNLLGERLQKLGRALRDREQLSIDALRALLWFGPESGVTVEGLLDFLNERQIQENLIRDYDIALRRLDAGPLE